MEKYTIDEVFEEYKKYSKEKHYNSISEAYFWEFIKWFKRKHGIKIPYED